MVQRRASSAGDIRLCVLLVPDDEAPRHRLDSVNAINARIALCFDCARYSDIQTERVIISGARAVLQTGAGAGPLGGLPALEPTLLAIVPVRRGRSVIVSGVAGSIEELGVLRKIVGTLVIDAG